MRHNIDYLYTKYFDFITNDNVRLNIGHGYNKSIKPKGNIVLIPGWGQSIEVYTLIWKNPKILEHYHTYAIDMRGHGQSEKVDYGYQMCRLTQDVREVICKYKLKNVILMGHSYSCSIMRNYTMIFGEKDIEAYIHIDGNVAEMSIVGMDEEFGSVYTWFREGYDIDGNMRNKNLELNEKLSEIIGTRKIITDDIKLSLHDVYYGLISPLGDFFRRRAMEEQFTPEWLQNNPEKFEEIYNQVKLLPLPQGATLLFNHSVINWNDMLDKSKKRALLIGGKQSANPYSTILYQASVVPNSQYYIFEQGGSHFMFIENPEEFIRLILNFLNCNQLI